MGVAPLHKEVGHPCVKGTPHDLIWGAVSAFRAGREENWGQESALGTATRPQSDFALHGNVHTDFRVHPTSYSVVTAGSTPEGKAGGAWSLPRPWSTDVKNGLSNISTLLIFLRGTYRDNCTFYWGRLRKITAWFWAEIWIIYLPNKKQTCQPLDRDLRWEKEYEGVYAYI
jgi:hypothetical protein